MLRKTLPAADFNGIIKINQYLSFKTSDKKWHFS